MRRRITSLLKDESGATASEYALMAGLIAAVAAAVVAQVGVSVSNLFQVAQSVFPGGGS